MLVKCVVLSCIQRLFGGHGSVAKAAEHLILSLIEIVCHLSSLQKASPIRIMFMPDQSNFVSDSGDDLKSFQIENCW